MQRYRSYGQQDDQPLVVGDEHFLGVDEYSNPENVQPAYVQKAVNLNFTSLNAETRGGFVCLPDIGIDPFGVNANWTGHSSAANKQWNSIAYGNGRYVALQGDQTGVSDVMYSADGTNWTVASSGIPKKWAAITYGNGMFVAVSKVTASDTFVDSSGNFLVSSAGDNFIASPNPAVMVSADGITWTQYSSAGEYSWSSITYGNSLFVAVADGDGGTTQVMTSPDGMNWTLRSTPASLSNHGWKSVTYGNNLFVAVAGSGSGSNNRAMYSSDGVTWTASTTPATPQNAVSVAFGNGLFVAVANASTSATKAAWLSSDGVSWTAQTTPNAGWTAVAFGNAVFTAVGNTGVAATSVMVSADGITWTSKTAASGNLWSAIAYGSPTLVAVSTDGYPNQVMTSTATDSVWGSGIYSDPNDIGSTWIMIAGTSKVGFYASGKTSRTVSLNGTTISANCTIVQANNQVFIFRGSSSKPLYWNGDWASTFGEVPDTSLPATYNSIPNSDQATYYQNRLWVKNGKDNIAASDVLAFTDYDPLANEFNLNTGSSDYVVATFPFGQNSLICFKNKSIMLLQNVEGSLTDVTVTEITRQVGLVGINAVTSVGPDLAYVSYGNINLLTLTNTNNALQHKTLPLSSRIRRIMDRVNWNSSSKISVGYWNNKLYVALPLDNSINCNAVVVYNFISESWYGEWNFSSSINMCIHNWAVIDYRGLQRLHAITDDGRIFVTDEGQNDISGTTVAEISTQLVTRAYNTSSGNMENRAASFNHFQRRMYADVSTNRPNFSISSFTDGANEESVLVTNEAYTRSQSWLFADSPYALNNSNNDYNRAYRRDYSTGPSSVQCGTGFLPEITQDIRIPLITRRQGRLSWLELTNTQGYLMLKSIGFENRAGQRGSTVQA